MSQSRDDMVMTPSLGQQFAPTARTKAREDRRTAFLNKRHGLRDKLLKARAAAKLRRAHTARMSKRTAVLRRGGRGGAAAIRGLSGGGGLRAAAASPIGAIVAAVVVAGFVAIRLGTGRSFENMGAQMNKMLIGDLDEQARAAIDTRKTLGGDKHIARIIAQEGAVNSQVKSIAEDLKAIRLRELMGASEFLEDKHFQADNTLDILIIRARDLLVQAFNGAGGEDAVANLGTALYLMDAGGDPREGSGR